MASQEGITTADQMVAPSTGTRLETKLMLDTMDADAELRPLADLFRRAGYLHGPDLLNVYNPGSYGLDLSVRREFPIFERLRFALQMDAINALNIVTLSAPPTNITSSNFGKISGQSNGPRLVQLSGRITF